MDIDVAETVVFRITKSGKYKIELTYRNSIIREIRSCPQTHFYISTLTEPKAKAIGKKQEEVMDTSISSYTKIEEIFSNMQNAINEGTSYNNDDEFDYIYTFSRESYSNYEENIYTNKLSLSSKPYWIYIEIFADQVINDIVVDMDFEERRFSRTSTMEQKLSAGKTDELNRSRNAISVFSMVMSYQDTYEIEFFSRNTLGFIIGFEEQFKNVMFQMKVQINPIIKDEMPLSMTSLLPKTFNNLRDLGLPQIKNTEMRFFRERILLKTKERNIIDFEITKPSRLRLALKSLVSDVGIKRVYIKDSSGTEIEGNIIEMTSDDIDTSYELKEKGSYTLYIAIGAKNGKFAEFFFKLEIQSLIENKR